MNIIIYNHLVNSYQALQIKPSEEKVYRIYDYIRENGETLAEDLLENSDHSALYTDLCATVTRLHIDCGLIEAIERIRNTVQDVRTAQEIGALFRNGEIDAETAAHFVNGKKTALKNLNLSVEELSLLAPHLHYINAKDIPFKDTQEIQNFINCSNAQQLIINSDKLNQLNQLPETLEELDCSACHSLKAIELSNLTNLKILDCLFCSSLTTLTLSNLNSLEAINRNLCSSLETVSLSNLPALESFDCSDSSLLTDLTLSNLPALKTLDCTQCHSISAMTLSNLTALESFDCIYCPVLKVLTLSNLTALKKLNCRRCISLETLVASNLTALEELDCGYCVYLEHIRAISLPNCRRFNCCECSRLRQFPQLPSGCTVVSYGSIDFTSFVVDPEKLKEQPLDVLCDLGAFLLRDKRMPNIVYLNSPGLDHGGLRRQLVTTLLKNLFGNSEGILPTMSDLTDEKQAFAFKTLGSLVALAALGSLPLGRHFRDSFYYALLHSEGESEKRIYQLLHALPESDEVAPQEITDNLHLIRPVALAAREFRGIVGAKTFELKPFINQVAGEEITFDAFARKAVYTGESERTKEYFQQFFEEYKESQKLPDIIELFTASRALGQESIKIYTDTKKNRQSLFEIATCFNQVTIPLYDTYETFKEKLLKTAECVLGQFDKA